MSVDQPVSESNEPWVQIYGSRHFAAWLDEQHVSLAFSTYQAGKLFLVGRRPDGQLSVHERTFSRCMGLAAHGDGLWMSSLYQLWRLENTLEPGEDYQGYDRLYVPRVGYTTGDIDLHDIAINADGQPIFANTKFSCLATLSPTASFKPVWKPPFITKLAPEDRCHLNGLALVDGQPKYVTVVSTSDVLEGWRTRRTDGGAVLDVDTGEFVATGLSMPHSPRWYRGQLWLHQSGTGEFGRIDLQTGRFEPVTFCPGYLRGLAFSGNYAIVGLSRPRHERTFNGLPLDKTLAAKGGEAQCGLQVIDLKTGNIEHWLHIEGPVEELYDVVTLPNVTRPMALGFVTDEIQRILSIDDT